MDDIYIVGGGPAGLAGAIAFRQAGFAVTVLDCGRPPIDKACGEGLMPAGVAILRQLGVLLPPHTGFAFKGIRLFDGNVMVAARFPEDNGLGLRRTLLHAALVNRATQLGVHLCWNAKNVSLAQLPPARLIVAADGQNSLLRRQAGLHRIKSEHRRYGFRKRYRVTPWSDHVEVYWGPRSQVYVTPVAADEVSVATLSRGPHLRVDQSLADFPALRERLAGASLVGPEKGALSVSRRLHRVHQDGFALLGDASGSVDAITGEGLSLAFQQALALAAAFQSGKMADYELAHRRAGRMPHRMASLLLALDSHAMLRRLALASMAKRPGIFAAFLNAHVGAAKPKSSDSQCRPHPSTGSAGLETYK
ncbi:MAG TPA: FAD-dependent monooxygenase [Bryobacteraceae bacterium]